MRKSLKKRKIIPANWSTAESGRSINPQNEAEIHEVNRNEAEICVADSITYFQIGLRNEYGLLDIRYRKNKKKYRYLHVDRYLFFHSSLIPLCIHFLPVTHKNPDLFQPSGAGWRIGSGYINTSFSCNSSTYSSSSPARCSPVCSESTLPRAFSAITRLSFSVSSFR
jgi:hypothetical protein